MLIRFIVFLSLTIFLLVSVGNTILVLFLKIYGVEFCSEINNLHLLTTLIVVSSVLSLIQIIGFVGTFKDSRLLRYIYTVFCCFFLIGSTPLAIALLVRWNEAIPVLSRCTRFDWNLKNRRGNWLIMHHQEKYQCCGLTSKLNWGSNVYPPSCCKNNPSVCIFPHEKPCAPSLVENGRLLEITVISALFFVVFLSVRNISY
ncbi:hypothetical protein RF11_13547 [Thelohanellus kitauei]|uniref:Uncharacterized protein n=1 Tax=Thelohanellus kitauei TaxID=669202 RepID=A0A0C2NIT0_THEKT|nr:hypothetical protein RF11_13547 [Thelohanellus kitauei]